MIKKLQLLVNHYREEDEIVTRFLDSIQDCYIDEDVEVIIANDGYEKYISDSVLAEYTFPLQVIDLPHRGMRATRNTLLDIATADYVMFCDIDDCFTGSNWLTILLDAIRDLKADIIGTAYLAELIVNGEKKYIKMKHDTVRVHGKVFKREYLNKNNLRFPVSDNYTGDMDFLWLAYSLTDNIIWLSDIFYIWKWYGNSTTRHHDHHNLVTYDKMIMSFDNVTKECIKRKRSDLRDQCIVTMIITMFRDLHLTVWNEIDKSYYSKAMLAAINYIKKYYPYYLMVDPDIRQTRYNALMPSTQNKDISSVLIVDRWIINLFKPHK